jgi:hypothetical protein
MVLMVESFCGRALPMHSRARERERERERERDWRAAVGRWLGLA